MCECVCIWERERERKKCECVQYFHGYKVRSAGGRPTTSKTKTATAAATSFSHHPELRKVPVWEAVEEFVLSRPKICSRVGPIILTLPSIPFGHSIVAFQNNTLDFTTTTTTKCPEGRRVHSLTHGGYNPLNCCIPVAIREKVNGRNNWNETNGAENNELLLQPPSRRRRRSSWRQPRRVNCPRMTS